MAYQNVDESRTWQIPAHGVRSPQVVEIKIPTTKTFVAMDFRPVLKDPVVAISTIATPAEVASKTITLADEFLDPTNRIVSFSVAAMAAGDYEIGVECALSGEAGNNVTGTGILRVK
jgi:hypothetical protein